MGKRRTIRHSKKSRRTKHRRNHTGGAGAVAGLKRGFTNIRDRLQRKADTSLSNVNRNASGIKQSVVEGLANRGITERAKLKEIMKRRTGYMKTVTDLFDPIKNHPVTVLDRNGRQVSFSLNKIIASYQYSFFLNQ